MSRSQSDKTQIGAGVDRELWSEFRDHVQAEKGVVRGHLSHELERAIRLYLDTGQDEDLQSQLKQIQSEIQAIRQKTATDPDQVSD